MNPAEERRWGRTKPFVRQGELLRGLRVQAGLSLRQISLRLAMSRAQLSEIERGIKPISLRRAKQIAGVLEVPCTQIIQAVLQDRLDAAGFEEIVVTVEHEPKR